MTSPNRKLDTLIAVGLCGSLVHSDKSGNFYEVKTMSELHNKKKNQLLRHFSSDLNLAWQLVLAHLHSGKFLLEFRSENDCWTCVVGSIKNMAIGKTESEAICKSLLLYNGFNFEKEGISE
jgi:hypothetical protein